MPRCGATFDENIPLLGGVSDSGRAAPKVLRWVGVAREHPPRLPSRPLSLLQPPLQRRGFSEEHPHRCMRRVDWKIKPIPSWEGQARQALGWVGRYRERPTPTTVAPAAT